MGLTLLAVLITALLLPGIVAAIAFYEAAQTAEVEATTPSLRSADGIAQIGIFSVFVHFAYVVLAKLAEGVFTPPGIAVFAAANPYVGMLSTPVSVDAMNAMIVGLMLLCIIAVVSGTLAGWVFMWAGHRTIFYGPLAALLAKTGSRERFIIADVLTTIEQEGALIGYRGTVVCLLRDADRFPAKVVLKNVSLIRFVFSQGGAIHPEAGEMIDWIALSAEQWHNIAFKVFEVVDDEQITGGAPTASAASRA